MMHNFEVLNGNDNLYSMVEECDLTSSYFFTSQISYQWSIDNIITSLKLKRYVVKYIEIGGGIGHDNRSDYDDSMRI